MNRFRSNVVAVIVTVAVLVPIGLGVTAISVSNARARARIENATSIKALCDAENLQVSGGFTKLVEQLRATTATSKQRTDQEKAAIEAFYTLLVADFPRLNCDATPIKLEPPTP